MKGVFFVLVFFIGCYSSSFSQVCDQGVMDCAGQCGRMIDENADGYCDYSPRSKHSNKPKSLVVKHTLSRPFSANPALQRSSSKLAKSLNGQNVVLDSVSRNAVVVQSNRSTATLPVTSTSHRKPYALLEIGGVTLFLYFLSMLLVKSNRIKKATHRKLWNVLLLLTFIMSGLLGLVLVVQLNYHFVMDWYLRFMHLHVEFGIAMAIISIIHVFWHTSYYMNMIRKKK